MPRRAGLRAATCASVFEISQPAGGVVPACSCRPILVTTRPSSKQTATAPMISHFHRFTMRSSCITSVPFSRSSADVERYGADSEFPVLVKPSQSHLFAERFGRKLTEVEDAGQLAHVARQALKVAHDQAGRLARLDARTPKGEHRRIAAIVEAITERVSTTRPS